MSLTAVTILAGFLGSGKTTLLNRILKEQRGHRIAVIENSFCEAGIDNELLVQDRDEQIVEMDKGCICCTVRGGLVRILGELHANKQAGQLHFDRVIIETTGLPDPAPVSQTFFVDDDIGQQYLLDAIGTMVDAEHAAQQLDEHHEAQEQVGFADRILITKTDVVQPYDVAQPRQRLVQMNRRAKNGEASHGQASIDDLLDVRGFNLNAILEIEPDFLTDVDHEHDDDVTSFVFREDRPLDLDRVEDLLGGVIQLYGTKLMGYKGVLDIKGMKQHVGLQGVHMLMGWDARAAGKPGERRASKMVFIGRDMPADMLLDGLAQCVATQGWSMPAETSFQPRISIEQVEEGPGLAPRFDEHGLLPCVTTDAAIGEVLMLGWMNAEALQRSLPTHEAHSWSRSRRVLWHKGATSGLVQRVMEVRVDDDQDAVWLRVQVQHGHDSPPASCHVGYRSCFYRAIDPATGALRFVEQEKTFDPRVVYGDAPNPTLR